MRNKIKLLDYQQEVKESKAKQVICRWGRRTGKDVLINELAGKKDLVIYPTYQMARVIY